MAHPHPLYSGGFEGPNEAELSATVAVVREDQIILDVAGHTQPGIVHFQVLSPNVGRSGVRIRVETNRQRCIGVQEFPIMSSAVAGFASTLPIIGGGWAQFAGGVRVTATRLAAGTPATVVAWIDYSPAPAAAPARCPDMLFAQIANLATLEFGPPPAGCREISIMSDQTFAGGLTLAWRDTGGATVAGWRQWDQGGPFIAPAGLSLIATNNTGAPTDVGVAWS